MAAVAYSSIQPLLLRNTQVTLMLGVHRNKVWNRVRAGKFPTPIKWEGMTVWHRKDVENFVEALAG
ncbi:MAG TPA: helix-turn-helix domain-containing protein [Paracoccus sp. (in: a-proteobacteria)]|uniref:helix-turn-helix transcriptional regulator n=1 Tax=Paracoccus sp. TaxID=267 RepID=UPI002B5CA3D1|nr:helix-turn-helix domain-containing protein [Paracoccus sp. (in: a-proteobacteria)]HWL55995.1 helix-turn-helix domain-containing protein [Paracoccus sp. (in: a-proteobacteria)]